ncbi:ferric reductase-like transmembrane domain-containing protein [Rhodocyclaceae bacterium]
MTSILVSLLAIVAAVWYGAFASAAYPPEAALPWIARREGLYLTGLASFALMSLVMLLAVRPAWLEKPLGGMDRIYRLHKWTGILAIGLGAAHWLVELSGDIIKAFIGKAGRLPKPQHDALYAQLRELAEGMGEWALYAALAVLVLTLWKRFPYHWWRLVHRAMPALYLMLAFHAALLAPSAYWTQPAGVLLALCLAVGVPAAFVSLAGRIGQRRRVSGTVTAVNQSGDVTEIDCRLDAPFAHHPGQFAFVTFDAKEGAHPFTIASADRGDGTVRFCVKALGDHTRRLGQTLAAGQPVRVEGPYGRFQLDRRDPERRQVWVAGGVGVTPFLAWLEALQAQAATATPADLHYCTRDAAVDPFVGRLETLCAGLSAIRLQVHDARRGELLDAGMLGLADGGKAKAEVWYCGPQGLAEALKRGLAHLGSGARFHQEAFEMR